MKNFASMKRRRRLVGIAVAALMLLFATQLMTAEWASASAPSSYGWWARASLGAAGPAIPPDVPPDGLFVQNASEPIALSALSFTVPPGASADQLTLSVSGTPVISDPPVVCPATSAFEPAQGGSWSDRPAYNCADPVRGIVSSDMKRVVFLVRQLLTTQSSSVVVLAGGPADRIAFEKPGLDALSIQLSSAPSSSESGSGTSVPIPTFAPTPRPAPILAQTPLPTTPPGQGHALSAPPPNVPGGSASGVALGSTRRRVGTTLGVALLLLSILYWSDGFGIVPLRSSIVARFHRKTA
jgi:hypothetical protein